MNYNSSFDQVFCLASTDHFYKLILPYTRAIPENIKDLVAEETRIKIGKNISYDIGFLIATCDARGMVVKEIELILPPLGEYLAMQPRYEAMYREEGKVFTVSIGVQIPIKKHYKKKL